MSDHPDTAQRGFARLEEENAALRDSIEALTGLSHRVLKMLDSAATAKVRRLEDELAVAERTLAKVRELVLVPLMTTEAKRLRADIVALLPPSGTR